MKIMMEYNIFPGLIFFRSKNTEKTLKNAEIIKYINK